MTELFKKVRRLLPLIIFLALVSCAGKEKKITLVETTDLHGTILPFDFIENEPLDASLAHISSYLHQLRDNNESVVLLDNGDNLQGQPEVYYYNFIDTLSPHFSAEAMNYLGYDAGTVGNHDFEAGHPVYDRLRKQYSFPLLAANAVDISTGKPYFDPYVIIEKNGLKIAVLGMVTPSIPEWLPPRLYKGIEFRDMVETAKKWMPEILSKKPDLVVGLFHSGWNREEFESRKDEFLKEDGSASVAWNVPGFDIIFNGHDHKTANEKFITASGDTVLMLNGGSRAQKIAKAEVVFSGRGKNRHKSIKGALIDVKKLDPDAGFVARFEPVNKKISEYVSRIIGTSEATLSSRDSYFGPSAFIDMIHDVQLKITGADISFTAPLSFDVKIPAGPVKVGDMFKLYRYENMLYTISLSGEEILKYLEYSYSLWFNTMKGPGDLLIKVRTGKDGRPVLTNGRAWLSSQAYNFDSASGIYYIVDVSKPEGKRITITGLTSGRIFDEKQTYRVAVNSYRGSGGGGHLSEGAGLTRTEIDSRLIASTDKDLRYYILQSIESEHKINPRPADNWKIVPVKWAEKAIPRSFELLFGSK